MQRAQGVDRGRRVRCVPMPNEGNAPTGPPTLVSVTPRKIVEISNVTPKITEEVKPEPPTSVPEVPPDIPTLKFPSKITFQQFSK